MRAPPQRHTLRRWPSRVQRRRTLRDAPSPDGDIRLPPHRRAGHSGPRAHLSLPGRIDRRGTGSVSPSVISAVTPDQPSNSSQPWPRQSPIGEVDAGNPILRCSPPLRVQHAMGSRCAQCLFPGASANARPPQPLPRSPCDGCRFKQYVSMNEVPTYSASQKVDDSRPSAVPRRGGPRHR